MVGKPKSIKSSKTTKEQLAEKADKNKKFACFGCNDLIKKKEFYKSFNKLHTNGILPYCIECIRKMICDDKGNVTLEKVQETLRLNDLPFLYDLWASSMEEFGDTFGNYKKNIALNFKYLTWKDSVFLPESDKKPNYDNINATKTSALTLKKNDFVLTDQIIDKWGFGYTDEEYYYFEKKWMKLIDNYGEKTSLHSEGLTTYIRFRVKEELATAKGDIKEAKEWGALASGAAKDGKINVAALSKSDISGGIELLPQLFEAVESKVGIISIMPKLKEQPYDDADLIIWCVLNYLRRLEDKPRIEYREIWNFYDNMLHDYFIQRGYNEEQIKKEKEKRNNIFRDLSEVYSEPTYEECDE